MRIRKSDENEGTKREVIIYKHPRYIGIADTYTSVEWNVVYISAFCKLYTL